VRSAAAAESGLCGGLRSRSALTQANVVEVEVQAQAIQIRLVSGLELVKISAVMKYSLNSALPATNSLASADLRSLRETLRDVPTRADAACPGHGQASLPCSPSSSS